MKNRIILLASLLILAGINHPLCVAGPLTLAREGSTGHVIAVGSDSTAVDRYAAEQLALYLAPMTGAEFAVIDAADLVADAPAIFVGLSAPARTRLGEPDPLAGFADQEHVWRSHGDNVFLYGKGIHGNLYAVMGFLEETLGWRWYSRFEYPMLPEHSLLTLEPFRRQRRFSFDLRSVDIQRGLDFPYQQGVNLRFDARLERRAMRDGTTLPSRAERPFVSAINDLAKYPHSLFAFIAPSPTSRGAGTFPWLEKQDYFDSHPEFFSLWERGQRVDNRQLCFSNPDLRAELTRNVLTVIDHLDAPAILSLTAQDTPGRFCYCEGCAALEARHGSIGGPLYDYLLEICAVLAEGHPDIFVHTLAYRRAQTQKPPVLPDGETLPANLIVDFAPIEDNYFADWDHPDERIQETYADLLEWSRITHPGNLIAWLYPNGWGSGYQMPLGNVQRTVTNMRKMHAAGVSGVFLDHVIHRRGLFSELRDYLILKLMQDIEADTDAIIREFSDYMYGPAAALFRRYLEELEAGRLAMTDLPPGVTYRSPDYNDRTFPYLTPENIHRWQGIFDEMMRLTEDGAEVRWHTNVKLARRELDVATLWKWFDLAEAHPGAYTDHQVLLDRIAAANATEPPPPPAWETRSMNRRWSTHPQSVGAARHFATIIQGGGQEKPLPEKFAQFDAARVVSLVPNRYRGTPTTVRDPDAARGFGVVVDNPGPPDLDFFPFGVHQWSPSERLISMRLELAEIEPGVYWLFELGEFQMAPTVGAYFGRSWQTHLKFGESLYEPGGENRWAGWVSIKFDGPTYGGEAEDDQVLVDRVVLINLSRDQFEAP